MKLNNNKNNTVSQFANKGAQLMCLLASSIFYIPSVTAQEIGFLNQLNEPFELNELNKIGQLSAEYSPHYTANIIRQIQEPAPKKEEKQSTVSQLNKPNKDGKIVKLGWEVALKSLDNGKLLQKTNFETDAEIKKIPFLVYEQEQASTQNNNQASKEFIKTQFDLDSSEPSNGYRITSINMTTGKAINAQKVNEKEEVLSGSEFAGASNKATFLHSCDNSTHTLLFQKVQLEIKCKK